MKRVLLAAAGILLLTGAVAALRFHVDLSKLRDWLPTHSSGDDADASSGDEIRWRRVDKSSLGFKLEMPGVPRRVVVQAENETGNNEPVSMLQVKLDSDRTFAVAWADKPPVVRMDDMAPEKTLDDARDGALARTAATTISEVHSDPQGYPGRDIEARNIAGGILDTRLIYAHARLYMLIATSPSAAERHEDDIQHFFNSFVIAGGKQNPDAAAR